MMVDARAAPHRSMIVAATVLALAAAATARHMGSWEGQSVAVPSISRTPRQGIDSRIVGGSEVAVGDRPYQAAVFIDGDFLCGGILIDPEWVMTGAKCVYVNRNVTVGLGINNLTDTADGRQVLVSDTFYKHENFSPETMHNDIALVKLPSRVHLTPTVKVIALPAKGDVVAPGTNLTLSGWGTLNDQSTYVVAKLHQVTVASISNEDCTSVFGPQIIFDGNICTSGAGGKGACNGDGGGPLTETKSGGNVTLSGIVSFGHVGGCQQGDPDGFTRISYYLDWIADTMAK